MENIIALRIDDIGASSKRFEVYSKRWRGLGNLLFLKYLPYFRACGPYREMRSEEWEQIFNVLRNYQAKLTVAVTACWVESDGTLIPFPRKFSREAAILKEGLQEGLLEIANHGLTHCVVQGLLFRPRLFSSNRKYHREFWDWIPESVHFDHICRSQEILQEYFETEITTLVPPGNVFSSITVEAAKKNGIRRINCQAVSTVSRDVEIVGNENVIAFHDREIVLFGIEWIEKKLESLASENRFTFVNEL